MPRTLAISACFLLLATVLASAQEPVATAPAEVEAHVQAPLPATTLTTLMRNSTEDQRTRMFRFIHNRYPTFGTDLLVLLQTRHPGIFTVIDRELQTRVAAMYPRLATDTQRILQEAINARYPQVRQEIAELIARNYPELLTEIGQSGSVDTDAETARLIRERHRALLEDVLTLLREQHPTLLQEVQREVLVKHPDLLVEVALLIGGRYTELSQEIAGIFAQRYPELIPGLLTILSPATEPDTPAEELAPAEE